MSETNLDLASIRRHRSVLLALSSLVLLFLGLILGFSMFAAPLAEDLNLAGNAGLTFNIMMILFCAGAILGGYLDRAFGIRVALISCAVLFAIGFCGTGIFGSRGLAYLYVLYGVVGGLGCGVGYNTIVAATNVWFPDKVGFSSGVLMMAFSFASLIFGNVALALRPLVGGMSTVLVILGIVVAALVVCLSFVLTRPSPEMTAMLNPGRASASGVAEMGEDDNVFKTPVFYLYYGWCIVVMGAGLAVIGNAASDATSLGMIGAYSGLLVGTVSMCGGFARMVVGLLFDRSNIKVVLGVETAIAAVGVAVIVTAFLTNQAALYVAGALMCGFSYGGVPVASSAFARQRFGSKNYPKNLSVVLFGGAFASLLNVIIGMVLGTAERMGAFALIAALLMVSTVAWVLFCRQWNRDVRAYEESCSA